MKLIHISPSSMVSCARKCAFSLCGLVVDAVADTRRWLRHGGLPAYAELALGVPLALIALTSDYWLSLRGHGVNMDGYIAAYLLATAPLIGLWWQRLRRGWRLVRRSMRGDYQPTFSVAAMGKALNELDATPSVLAAFGLVPVLTVIGFALSFPTRFLVELYMGPSQNSEKIVR
ncbi:MAG: hypothetical protein KA754_06730 [Corallincola sp.]|nr:hypothetical protein [Corallincola sp.]